MYISRLRGKVMTCATALTRPYNHYSALQAIVAGFVSAKVQLFINFDPAACRSVAVTRERQSWTYLVTTR